MRLYHVNSSLFGKASFPWQLSWLFLELLSL